MEVREFHDIGELEEASNQLARATQHPIFVDTGQSYSGGEPDAFSDPRHLEDDVAIWNNRDDQLAYHGTTDYALVQHREVVDMIRSAVSDTVGEIDKGVIRDYGTRVDGTIVFGNQENALIDVGELVGDDYVIPEGRQVRDTLGLGMRFQNSFDGGSKIGGSTMGYRYICGNWMVWGEETIGEVDRRHIGEIDEDFFAGIIQEVFETRDQLEGIVVDAEHEEVPLSWVDGLLENIGFGKRYRKRLGRRVLEQDRPQEDETTVWRLYNAITTELDNEQVEKVKQHTYQTHQLRAWNLIENEPQHPGEERDLEELVEA